MIWLVIFVPVAVVAVGAYCIIRSGTARPTPPYERTDR